MPEPLDAALTEVRALLLDPAPDPGGRRRPAPRAAALGGPRRAAPGRPSRPAPGCRSPPPTAPGRTPATSPPGAEADAAVDELLAEPFGNWHVETADATLQLRVTKSGEAQVHRATASRPAATPGGHDRAKEYLLDPGDPIFAEIGGSAAKRRQVDAFLRALAATLPDDLDRPAAGGRPGLRKRLPDLRRLPLPDRPRAGRRRWSAWTSGRTSGSRNTELAERLGWADRVSFVAGTIADARRRTRPGPGAGAARLRHRYRRGAGPGGALGRPLGARRAVLPPRPGRAAARPARRRRRTSC